MATNRVLAQDESRGNLGIRQAFGYKLEDLDLPGAEAGGPFFAPAGAGRDLRSVRFMNAE